MTRGTEITNPWKNGSSESDYVTNRLKDILENSIIVQDKSATTSTGKSVWVTKGGCPVILEGTGANIRITTPYRKELADQNSSNSPDELKVREWKVIITWGRILTVMVNLYRRHGTGDVCFKIRFYFIKGVGYKG